MARRSEWVMSVGLKPCRSYATDIGVNPIRLLFLLPAVAFSAPTESSEVFKSSRDSEVHYLQYLPDGYESAGKPGLPLVIFLHGAGERGNDLAMVKKHGPPKRAMDGHGYPFILAAPQCPPDRWWNAEDIIALTKHLVKTLKADPDRVHLTGLSMGGFGTWACLAREPKLYASGAPICGGGDPAQAAALKDIPIWAFHGELDEAVPVGKTREMEDAILKAGGKRLRVTYYPDAKHDSWTETYDNPAFFAWMMLQRR